MRTKRVLNPERSRGAFTLIELLIVITIIAILATLIFVNVASARKKARDAKRKADLKNIQTALELYNEDRGGYPDTGGAFWGPAGCGYGSHTYDGANAYIPGLTIDNPERFVNKLPQDSVEVANQKCYVYAGTSTDYKFMALGTVEGTISSSDQYKDPANRAKTYTIYTPGASAW